MINAYVEMWKNGLDFSGRTRRRDYWLAVLMNICIGVILELSDIGNDLRYGPAQYNLLQIVYLLLMFIPLLSMGVRRLHDIDKSGSWLLIGLLPIIGAIVLLIFNRLDSGPDNEYGLNPKIE
jgi:uncharacterized membrane protein YhaH (DUF805 family)